MLLYSLMGSLNCTGPVVDSICVITCLEHKDDRGPGLGKLPAGACIIQGVYIRDQQLLRTQVLSFASQLEITQNL